jgi:hypothetical protein
MQTMQYVLKTGFGESTETYGGTVDAPNSGLGQGSGASPHQGFWHLVPLLSMRTVDWDTERESCHRTLGASFI